MTFDTRLDASAWLKAAGDVERGLWNPEAAPRTKVQTVAGYVRAWLSSRELKPRTRMENQALLDAAILPALGGAPLDRVTPTTIRNWYATLDSGTPTRRAHAYSLLRSIFTTAVSDDLVPTNPCRIRGAGSAKTKHKPQVASLSELEVIVAAMPARYRMMVLLAAWCGLRFGELGRRPGDSVRAGGGRRRRSARPADPNPPVGEWCQEADPRMLAPSRQVNDSNDQRCNPPRVLPGFACP